MEGWRGAEFYCDILAWGQWKLRRRGNLYKKGKIVQGASVINPRNTTYTDKTYWTDEEIQRMLHNVHLSVVKTWSEWAVHIFWNENFLLDKDRTKMVG
jgi:hypothetical protein